MSTTLTNPQIQLLLAALLQGATFPNSQSIIDHSPAMGLGVGSGAGNVLVAYEGPISVVSGTPFTLNLVSGLDPQGNALGMGHLVAWLLENDSTVGNLVVGVGTHPVMGASDQATVNPAISAGLVGVGFGLNPTGWTVTGGSSDTLTITASTGTISGKLTLLGR